MDPIMTRARTGSLPGHATSAAPDVDLRDGGRSGSLLRLGGYALEPSSRTSESPYYSSNECTPETVDSRAKRGDSDTAGRARAQPPGGGEQVSAEAASHGFRALFQISQTLLHS
jgi:hypothetical protein